MRRTSRPGRRYIEWRCRFVAVGIEPAILARASESLVQTFKS